MSSITAVVLHVEDDPGDRGLVALAFARTGLTLVLRSVEDGEAAIRYLNGEDIYANRARYPFPDFLVTDLKLPRKSGFEVLEWIRNNDGMSDLPVTILSSSSQLKDKAQANECRANDYFVKPASFFELVAIVGQIAHQWMPEPQQTIDEGSL